MTKSIQRFLIVDDDHSTNFLHKMALRKLLGDVDVKDFVMPETALEYIGTEFNHQHDEKTTLFLDINMPTITGWDFLEKFDTFPESIKNHFNIYILSSSIDPADIQRAKLNPLVIDFIEKPLNKAILIKLFKENLRE